MNYFQDKKKKMNKKKEDFLKKKNSVLKYNLLKNKTYTLDRLKHEKRIYNFHKSEFQKKKRYDFWGTEINDKKNHQIKFDMKKTKICNVVNYKKYNVKNTYGIKNILLVNFKSFNFILSLNFYII